jgi:hypothetical protein
LASPNTISPTMRAKRVAALDHAKPVSGEGIHRPRWGNKYSAASYFRQMPRAMHTEAERTERHLLPEVLADVIERREARRRAPHGRST